MPCILVADDDDVLRQLSRRVLESAEYVVYTAHNGMSALITCDERPGEIALLVSGIQLSDMAGMELWRLARESQPELALLLAVGKTELAPSGPTVEKPIRADQLLQRVRDCLRGSTPAAE